MVTTSEAEHRDTVLWLIRHPEPEESSRGVCYGSLDVPLSSKGIQQAHSMAEALADQQFDAICTSPSRRCLETANIIAAGRHCAVEMIDALRELNFGEFEGRSYDEIAALHPELYRNWMDHPTETQFPGGEDFAKMSDRVIDGTRQVLRAHNGEKILFVTHGGTIRVIVADALSIAPYNIFRIGQRYGAINCIRYSTGDPVVDLVNSFCAW